MQTRPILTSFKVTAEELAMARQLAEASDEPLARMFRRMIADHYKARFGTTEPDAKHYPKTDGRKAKR
jgi:hypothetical protein